MMTGGLVESSKDAGFARFVVRTVALNATVSIVTALGAYLFWHAGLAYGILFGGAIASMNMLLLGNRLTDLPADTSRAGGRIAGGVIQRFVLTLFAFALGFKYLNIPLPGMVAGLLVNHVLFFSLALRLRRPLRR